MTESEELNTVTCFSDGCRASGNVYGLSIGTSPNAGVFLTKTPHGWTAGESPASGGMQTVVEDMACVSFNQCAATGGLVNESEGSLFSSSPSGWSAQPAPLPADGTAGPKVQIGAVSCSDPGLCTAVGYYESPMTSISRGLIETFG